MWFLEVFKEDFPFIKKRNHSCKNLTCHPEWNLKYPCTGPFVHIAGVWQAGLISLCLCQNFVPALMCSSLLLLSISFFSVVYIRVLFCSVSISYLFLPFGHLLTQKTHTWTNTNKALDSFCVRPSYSASLFVSIIHVLSVDMCQAVFM